VLRAFEFPSEPPSEEVSAGEVRERVSEPQASLRYRPGEAFAAREARRAGEAGAASLPTFLEKQESRSPVGASPGAECAMRQVIEVNSVMLHRIQHSGRRAVTRPSIPQGERWERWGQKSNDEIWHLVRSLILRLRALRALRSGRTVVVIGAATVPPCLPSLGSAPPYSATASGAKCSFTTLRTNSINAC
jgi:hypothetical protein